MSKRNYTHVQGLLPEIREGLGFFVLSALSGAVHLFRQFIFTRRGFLYQLPSAKTNDPR